MRQAMYGPTKLMNFKVHRDPSHAYCFIIDSFGV